jgi:hypothetical protein
MKKEKLILDGANKILYKEMLKMENVKNETEAAVFNHEGLFTKLKAQLIESLGYNDASAEEQAKSIVNIFDQAYSKN